MEALEFWFYTLPKSQLLVTIPEQTSSFEDQTVIITGANTGLGYEAARQIAHLGAARVILACRTLSTGEAAANRIRYSLEGNKDCILEVWTLDISSYKSIKAFVEKASTTLDRLDAVIQNAGMISSKWEIVEESGDEKVLTTNLTGPVLFGLSILPKLRESAKKTGKRGRLTFVGSDTHYVAKLNGVQPDKPIYETLNDQKIADLSARYPATKLLLYLTIREIAARSQLTLESNVLITTMTPGLCYSDIARNSELAEKVMLAVFRAALARSTIIGGRTLVHAVKPDLQVEAHGKFLVDCRIGKEPKLDLQKRFSDEIFAKLEGIHPGVTACLA